VRPGGLGEAIARPLHARDASVVVADVNDEGGAVLAAVPGERARGRRKPAAC